MLVTATRSGVLVVLALACQSDGGTGLAGTPPANVDSARLSAEEQEIVRVALPIVAEMGYPSGSMDVSVTLHSVPWNHVLPQEATDNTYVRERQDKLRGRQYWTVYFSPTGNVRGGDVAVFLDAGTREMITTYRGK